MGLMRDCKRSFARLQQIALGATDKTAVKDQHPGSKWVALGRKRLSRPAAGSGQHPHFTESISRKYEGHDVAVDEAFFSPFLGRTIHPDCDADIGLKLEMLPHPQSGVLPTVVSVSPFSPAATQHPLILHGDAIISYNGTLVSDGVSVATIEEALRGPHGSTITLGLKIKYAPNQRLTARAQQAVWDPAPDGSELRVFGTLFTTLTRSTDYLRRRNGPPPKPWPDPDLYQPRALGFLARSNALRRLCIRLVEGQTFRACGLGLLLVATTLLALHDPLDDVAVDRPHSPRRDAIAAVDALLSVGFVLETLPHLVAFGVLCGQTAYDLSPLAPKPTTLNSKPETGACCWQLPPGRRP